MLFWFILVGLIFATVCFNPKLKQGNKILRIILISVVGIIFISVSINTIISFFPKTDVGINAISFDANAKSDIGGINSGSAIATVKPSVDSSDPSFGSVELTLSNIQFWSNSDDTSRKEFINSMGNLMDSDAVKSEYSGTKTVGVTTTIYSPSGLELGERTATGDVVLK